jgi:DNA-binding response OmpR family regulator
MSVEEQRPRILIIEDDPLARRFLADNLTADGYDVIEAATVAAARRLLEHGAPALALLDLGLADGDGLELLSLVRRGDRLAGRIDPDLPVIVVSGRGTEVERLRGFDRGADDYVVKPYSLLELTARIGALLRRRSRPAGARLRVGPIEIDVLARLVWLHGEPLHLSSKEFSLLRALAADPGRVFTRQELMRTVWGYDGSLRTRTLDTHVARLRRKLGAGGDRFIVNAWGVGYRLLDGGAA